MTAISLQKFKSRRMGKRGARKNRAAAQPKGNFLMELSGYIKLQVKVRNIIVMI
jgi:hypothetical protein